MSNPLSAQMQALINYANETTGEADTDLSAAVGHLVDGYGSGGMEPYAEYEFELTEDFTSTTATTVATTNISIYKYFANNPTQLYAAKFEAEFDAEYLESQAALAANATTAIDNTQNFTVGTYRGVYAGSLISYTRGFILGRNSYYGGVVTILARCDTTVTKIEAGKYKLSFYKI